MEQPNNDIESFWNEKFEEFRKEIDNFWDLPESTFANQRSNMGDKLTVEEARNLHAHAIRQRINNAGFPQDKLIELTHRWEKEIMGFKERRTMYNPDGSVI